MIMLKEQIHNYVQKIPLDGINYPKLEDELINLLINCLTEKKNWHEDCNCSALTELIEELQTVTQNNTKGAKRMTDKREQAVYELMLLYPSFKCTCDEVIREAEIFQAKGHYHHCMLWLVSHAIERSFMYSDGYRLVNGKMTLAGDKMQK